MSKQAIGWGCVALAISVFCATHQQLVAQGTVSASRSNSAASNAPAAEGTAKPFSPRTAGQRIDAVLDRRLKIPLRFEGEQLDIVLESIAEKYNIPIVIDRAALGEVGISLESEVTISLQRVSLRSAISLMLKQPGMGDLAYVVDSEVLLITTEEKRNETLITRVYSVDGLLVESSRFNDPTANQDLDDIADTIVACVEPESWMENGTGPGDIQSVLPGMLVVRQARYVHRQIEELLRRIRRRKRQIMNGVQVKKAIRKPITRGFSIQAELGGQAAESQARLARAIQSSVDWSATEEQAPEQETWIEVFPDRVLVRHFPEVLNQVELVLADTHLLDPAQMPTRDSKGNGKSTGGGSGFGGGGGSF